MDGKWLLDFLKTLRICVTNLRIYPLNNTTVQNALNLMDNLLGEYFKEKSSVVTLTELSGKVSVVGFEGESSNQEIKSISEELGKNFVRCRVSSISIKNGYTREELIYVIQNLSKYFRDDWAQDAASKGYEHLGFNQVKYVAITQEQMVVDRISNLFSGIGQDVPGIMSALKEIYDEMDAVPQEVRPALTTKLAIELSKQDASVLREIFDRELPAKIEESGLKEKLMAALTKEKISDVYQQIIKWYSDIKSAGASDFEAVEQLDNLKKFLSRMLECPAAKEVPFKFYEELFNLGLIDSIPPWAEGAKQLPENFVEQLEILRVLPEEEMVSSLWAEKIPEIFEKLISARLREDIIKFILKITANRKNEDYTVRRKAVELLSSITRILKSRGYDQLLTITEHLFLEWLEKEEHREIYETVTEMIFERIISRVLHSEFEEARKQYEFLMSMASEINRDEEKRKFISNYLSRRVGQLVPMLFNDVKSGDEIRRKNAFEFLSKIGDEALDPLVKIIKEVDDARIRLLAAGILKDLGSQAVFRIKEELNLGLTKEEIKRFIEILKFFGDGNFFEETKQLLRYPDPEVKSEVLRYLSSIDMPGVDKLIVENFNDPYVARVAVRLCGERRMASGEVVSALIHLVSTTNDWDIKEEAAISMGEIAAPAFEKPLVELLNRKNSFFLSLFKPVPEAEQERVRIRVAYVLRRFTPSNEIISALKKASRDKKSHAVAVTAAETLRLLEQQQKSIG